MLSVPLSRGSEQAQKRESRAIDDEVEVTPRVILIGPRFDFLEELRALLASNETERCEVETFQEPLLAIRVRDSEVSLYVVSESMLELPGISEFAAAAEAGKVPVVFLLNGEENVARVRELGAVDFFVEPVECEDLVLRIRGVLEMQIRRKKEVLLQEARWKFVVDDAEVGTWDWDLRADEITCSSGLQTLGLIPGVSFSSQRWYSLIHPGDRERLAAAHSALRKGTIFDLKIEYRFLVGDRAQVWIRERSCILRQAQGTPCALMGVIADTTESRANERRLVELANYDVLTDLPNRTKCRQFLSQAQERVRSTGSYACLFRIDISGLAQTNQCMGRTAGDAIIKQLAQRLKDYASDPERVCRLGGKEFALLDEQIEASSGRVLAAESADRIAREISRPFEVSGNLVDCACHVGACLLPEEPLAPEEVIRRADIALASTARNRVAFAVFRESMLEELAARTQLLNELKHAVFSDEVGLEYQPVVDTSGKVVGVEAFARWYHPTRGTLPAADFIPLAESSGLIVPLGTLLRRIACRQLAAWAQLPQTAGLVVSVNVSPVEFAAESFAGELTSMVQSMGIDASKLQLELSEQVVRATDPRLEKKFQTLSAAGIQLALDDFGTGSIISDAPEAPSLRSVEA